MTLDPALVAAAAVRRADYADYEVDDDYAYSAQQLVALKATSLAVGALSVASAILAFCWFVRMRRNFRHDLIMLLIQSDMFKSLWFAIYPIVSFAHGPIGSSSPFCQVSGFFLTAGIEASDIAVLLIALHTGLNIFRPRHTGGELGLFPYRNVAYLAWFVIPLVIAGLAFVRGPHGYVDDGRWCYLPAQPEWPRLALSWVPRFVIFVVILLTYGYVYYYVSVITRRFGKESKIRQGLRKGCRRSLDERPPQVPNIQYHGLIPSTPPSRRASRRVSIEGSHPREQSPSRTSIGSLPADTTEHVMIGDMIAQASKLARRSRRWNLSQFGFGNGGTQDAGTDKSPEHPDAVADASVSLDEPVSPKQRDPPLTPMTTHGGFLAVPLAAHVPPRRDSTSSATLSSRQGRAESASDAPEVAIQMPARSASRLSTLSNRPPFLSIFRPGDRSQPGVGGMSGSASSSRTDLSAEPEMGIFLSPSVYDVSGLAKTREKIRRQVRLMFVYPLVYMLLWVPQLIAHVFKWHDSSTPVPFAVSVLSIATIAAQGAINCWLFSTREKPWKHKAGSSHDGKGTHNSNSSRRTTRLGEWAWPGTLERGYSSGPGRTREEMLADGKMAHRRRLQEESEERNLGPRKLGSDGEKAHDRPAKEWWDAEEERSIGGVGGQSHGESQSSA